MRFSGLLLLAMLAACATAKSDAPPPPARDIISGAARIRGGGVRMDVEIGHAFRQGKLAGNGKTAKPATVVTP